MRARSLRRLTAVLALACAGLEPATGITLFVSAFDQRSDHAHSLSVVSDVGHVDVVLSHAEERTEEAPAPRAAGRAPEIAPDPSQRDHVYHITTSDLPNATRREAAVAHAAPTRHAVVGFAPAGARIALPHALRKSHGRDPLSTIVLQI